MDKLDGWVTRTLLRPFPLTIVGIAAGLLGSAIANDMPPPGKLGGVSLAIVGAAFIISAAIVSRK